MAQDGGVDPHNISVALGFLDRCQRRLTSSCILKWHRTEVSILVLLGQSQVCSHYTSPVFGARGEI